jgi:hypothetical protein
VERKTNQENTKAQQKGHMMLHITEAKLERDESQQVNHLGKQVILVRGLLNLQIQDINRKKRKRRKSSHDKFLEKFQELKMNYVPYSIYDNSESKKSRRRGQK